MAHVCKAKGYNLVIYMPNTQSQGTEISSKSINLKYITEKIDLLRFLGADVRPVPAVAFDNPDNYNHQARRHAESMENAIWGNQFDNVSNKNGHYLVRGISGVPRKI